MRDGSLKILILNYEFPPLGGGAGNATQALAKHFASLGNAVCVLSARDSSLPSEETLDGYCIQRIRTIRKRRDRSTIFEMAVFLVVAIVPAIKLALSFKPNVIHCHFIVPTGILAYLLKVLFKIPFVLTIHGGDVPNFVPDQTSCAFRFVKPFANIIWNAADARVAVSLGIMSLALQSYPLQKILSIPNGTDMALTEENYEKKFHGKSLIFIGRLVHQKGLDILLNALSLMRSSIPDFSLTIVGDGPLMKSSVSLAKQLSISNNCVFHGWVSEEEVLRLLKNADIYVLPSRSEAFSVTLLRALSLGIPIIASNVYGVAECIENEKQGIITPISDEEALASALSLLLGNIETLQKMSHACKERSRDFSWDAIAKRYIGVFHEICV